MFFSLQCFEHLWIACTGTADILLRIFFMLNGTMIGSATREKILNPLYRACRSIEQETTRLTCTALNDMAW